VIRILLFLTMAAGAMAQTGVLPMRFANLPACAGESATPRPKAEADGSYLLLRVNDPSGLGIEIWCAKEAAGYNYQYRVAGSEGRSRLLDRCQLADGISSAGVEHEGPVAETPLVNGGQQLRTAGRLVKFFHHNWDTRRGHHAIYDFRRRMMTIYTTVAMRDGAGRWVRSFESVNSYAGDALPEDIPAAMGKTLPERSFDAARVSCVTALADEGYRLEEQEVTAFMEPDRPSQVTVAWTESSPIEAILFEPRRRELLLRFKPGTRKALVSLALPRKMLGLGRELSHVRLDGRFVESDELNTATHKSIRFRIDEAVKEGLIKESQGFPFFVVTGTALLGAVLIGGVIGLLFRRTLPPVVDNPDPRDAVVS
jgi:hypothetical protein